MFLNTLVPSIICVHFSQLVDHYVTWTHTPYAIIKHTQAKILASTLECQVSWDDTTGDIIGH